LSYESLLTNTCSILRFTEGAADGYGNPAKTWAYTYEDEPCRWSTPANREVKIGAEVVLADLQLFLGADIDVTEQDRVELNGATYEVLSSADRQDGMAAHHVECLLRSVR
jgi:hypothetical protein